MKSYQSLKNNANKAVHPTPARVALPAVASLLGRKRATGRCGWPGTLAKNMEYVEINTGPWDDNPDSWWARLLTRILPQGSPDFVESLYPHTRRWWVELDDERVAQREIGFNEQGEAIVLGPVGWNHGFAVDYPRPWSKSYAHCEEAARRFEETWDGLWPRFAHLEEKESQQAGTCDAEESV